jgi:hypothetical protein
MSDAASLQAVWARADAAKEREIDCHRRAIVLHDDTAARFELLGHPAHAAAARKRSTLALDALHAARAEQAETKARRSRFVTLTRFEQGAARAARLR